MRRALAVSLLVSGALACNPRPVTYQPQPLNEQSIQDTIPESASLLRRLAEAADGYRDGKDKWVVASRRAEKGNHRVAGVFDTFQEADFTARREGPEYAAFGPYRTPKEEFLVAPNERVGKVIVVYVDGRKRSYDADSVDALFWGLSAFDKFIVPYLSSIASAEYAAEQRELYRLGRSELAGSEQVAHKKGSF
jgi:hypothetical protein